MRKIIMEKIEEVFYERDWLGRHCIVLKGEGMALEVSSFDPFSRTYPQHTHLREREQIKGKFLGADRVEICNTIGERYRRRTITLLLILLGLFCFVPLLGTILILPVLYDLERERKKIHVKVDSRYLGAFKKIVVYRGGRKLEYHSFLELLQ
ncbi:MAG: hypothetical protein DRN03_05770 [Thermoplasmata archaeon]|nr:MAG: hypothetical protein DRN03_05770 [Thermoplasmata archaeon]